MSGQKQGKQKKRICRDGTDPENPVRVYADGTGVPIDATACCVIRVCK